MIYQPESFFKRHIILQQPEEKSEDFENNCIIPGKSCPYWSLNALSPIFQINFYDRL